jgi:tRNA(Ile)-lysidine synthase
LLKMWREETVVYCAVNGLRPHYDSSNDSLNFQRNRIRHLLVPSLESYNPKFRESVLRMSESLKGDYAFIMETLEKAWRETVTIMEEEVIAFDSDLLSNYSIGLQRNLVKQAMQILRPGLDISFTVLERATNLLKSTAHSTRVDLKGGLRMFRELNHVYICTLDAELPFNLWPQMTGTMVEAVTIPGQVDLAGGWKFNCERWRIPTIAKEQAERNEDQFQVWLDAENFPESLELRIRHQGDHFAPLGMNGHSQKISDFFVNEKMPQRAREHWPLLCVGNEIIWVPGYRPAHKYRLTDSTRNVIYFSVIRPPEKMP